MAVSRATLDNSGESFIHIIKRWTGVRDFTVRRRPGYGFYGWSEVVKHDKPEDCWIVVHGKVYDVTEWVPKHPGGKVIYDGAGGDCSAVWESYHPLSTINKGIPTRYLIGEIRDFQDYYAWDGDFYRNIKQKVESIMPREIRRDDPSMNIKGLILLVAYFIGLFLYIYFCTWWSAVLYGALCSQIGVNIMHDGNHGAFTSSKTLSWLAGYTLDLVGSSSVVYRRSHNYGHHSCVNHYELDRSFDTTFPYMRLHYKQERRWYHQYQHLYAWLLYLFVNFGDMFGTFDELFWMSNYPNRRGHVSFGAFVFQAFVKICWLFYSILIPSYIHGYVNIFPIWFLYMTVFSVGYSLFFAVNHWTTDAGFVDNSSVGSANWGVLQVENSVNFALESKFWTWLTGGLNHQIEHHLFPAVVHTRLPMIRPIVKQACKEYGVRYHEYPSFYAALTGHYRLLKLLGKFDNPPLIFEEINK
jgi:fatty acid desaturase